MGRWRNEQPFFDSLVGEWTLDGTILGKPLVQDVTVDWILGERYLRIHYLPSTVTPLGTEPYEALAFIGFDPEPRRFCMELFDTFGGGFSPPGFGSLEDGQVRFVFDYASGPFSTTFRPEGEDWVIELFGSDGPFGMKRLRKQ